MNQYLLAQFILSGYGTRYFNTATITVTGTATYPLSKARSKSSLGGKFNKIENKIGIKMTQDMQNDESRVFK